MASLIGGDDGIGCEISDSYYTIVRVRGIYISIINQCNLLFCFVLIFFFFNEYLRYIGFVYIPWDNVLHVQMLEVQPNSVDSSCLFGRGMLCHIKILFNIFFSCQMKYNKF